MELTQKQSQKLSMTAAMLQSLELLQLPVCELVSHLQDAALSNPLLEVELPGVGTLAAEEHTVLREAFRWDNLPSSGGDENSLENLAGAHTETFSEHLAAQLRQSQLLKPGSFLRLCLYLTDCLDERGYLTIPLEELAVEQGCSKAEAEQALFALQMLDPPGVGARDLTECLILQLARCGLQCADGSHGARWVGGVGSKGLCEVEPEVSRLRGRSSPGGCGSRCTQPHSCRRLRHCCAAPVCRSGRRGTC